MTNRAHRSVRGVLLGLWGVLALGACSGGSTAFGPAEDLVAFDVDAAGPGADALLPDLPGGFDTPFGPSDGTDGGGKPDGGPTPDMPSCEAEGGFGCPCLSNTDCVLGYCVEGPDGYFCTRPCLDECPAGYVCRAVLNTEPDVVFICVPLLSKRCQPCNADFQCPGGLCLPLEGDQSYCTTRCTPGADEDRECGENFHCAAFSPPEGGADLTVCQPDSGACSCRGETAGQVRGCTRANAYGECAGFETCDPAVGWNGCDAAVPVPETCDYADNDCDGNVDEDFREGGRYIGDESCGSCFTSCTVGFPHATAYCDARGEPPLCKVQSCDPGYYPLNEFQCVPNLSTLCNPCTVDAECVADGARCIQLTDGRFCSQPCGGGLDCPPGYLCVAVPEDPAVPQCVPEAGTCSCGPVNEGVRRPCTLTVAPAGGPTYECAGFETCEPGGWGACSAADREVCDGLDNDCDGLIDNPWLNPATGLYEADEHCGTCAIRCDGIDWPNASGRCDPQALPVPQCVLACAAGHVDVDGEIGNGCECEFVSTVDVPNGQDLNCDGVDGDIAAAVFVTKNGSDAAAGTIDAPLLTIGAAVARAAASGKRDVYVATGVYSESVTLPAGVSVYGGYASDFRVRDRILYETVIFGAAPTTAQPGAVNGFNLRDAVAPVFVNGFSIYGFTTHVAGESSYGVYLSNCDDHVTLSENRIYAGDGGDGVRGSDGQSGRDGVDGQDGAPARDGGWCMAGGFQAAGGGGGAQTCNGATVSGGGGGNAYCPQYGVSPNAQRNGIAGSGGAPGGGGAAGWDLEFVYPACGQCRTPPDNHAWNGGDGTAGNGGNDGPAGGGCAMPAGAVIAGLWQPGSALAGGNGGNGSGGGGGGAGGGAEVDVFCSGIGGHDVGGSGGGGGSGGCGGTGGYPGTGGGGSFGVFLTYPVAPAAVPVVVDNVITTGSGGYGGGGGNGGTGGEGGLGHAGGLGGQGYAPCQTICWCAALGGHGGPGGSGGHGGGGGGGCGGASFGIFVHNAGAAALAPLRVRNTFLGGGEAGEGGPGGRSLGGEGQAGAPGAAGDVNF